MVTQVQVLCKILNTGDFSLVRLNNLSSKHFFNYESEFDYINNHFQQYRKVPDKLTFLGVFPDFDIVEVHEPDSFLIENLFRDYNQHYLAARFNTIRNMLSSNEVDAAVDYFMRSTENLQTGGAMTCTDIMQDTSRYERFLERTQNPNKFYLSTGFLELDAAIGGIDRENENMVIAARPGIGKSYTIIKMAVAASMQGLNVGFYSGEMTVDKVAYRVDAILSHIKNSSLNRGDLYVNAEYKQYIDSLSVSNYGPLKILTPNDICGPATVPALEAFVDKEKLDILFIDQYSLLEDTSKAKQTNERVANISKAIKQLQVSKHIPIVSVSQMNRTKNEDDSQDTTQIGLSDRIGQDATTVIMLSRDDDKLILNIVKARDGGDGKKLTYQADLNKGLFNFIPDENSQVVSDEELDNIRDSYSVDYCGQDTPF